MSALRDPLRFGAARVRTVRLRGMQEPSGWKWTHGGTLKNERHGFSVEAGGEASFQHGSYAYCNERLVPRTHPPRSLAVTKSIAEARAASR
jgi:hypothetical protein